MLHFEASNPRWGVFADAMYIKLSDGKNLPIATVSGETNTGIYEGGLSYRLRRSVEGLLGIRHQSYKLEALVLPTLLNGFSRRNHGLMVFSAYGGPRYRMKNGCSGCAEMWEWVTRI